MRHCHACCTDLAEPLLLAWTDASEASAGPPEDQCKPLTAIRDLLTTDASLPALKDAAKDIVAMRPDIAANWQPGSIVAYSAWGLFAYACSSASSPQALSPVHCV